MTVGVAPPWLNDIIKGKGKVSTKIAKKLETLFGVPAIVWITWHSVDELNKE
jgi:plasmid maintenance system antidote protein VapI